MNFYKNLRVKRVAPWLPHFMGTSVLVFCLYPVQAPHGLCYCCWSRSTPLTTVSAQLVFECWTRPLSLGFPSLYLPLLLSGCCLFSCFKMFWSLEDLACEPMPKHSGTRCYLRPAKMLQVGMKDPYLCEFHFVPESIGCMEEVGQSGKPAHH